MADFVDRVRNWLADADAWDEWPAAEAAILGVLNVHRPRGPHCGGCTQLAGGDAWYVEWPCQTVRAVANGLGVEMPESPGLVRVSAAGARPGVPGGS